MFQELHTMTLNKILTALTNHLGDSGMKNKPITCNIHGIAPENDMQKKLLSWNNPCIEFKQQNSIRKLPIKAKMRQVKTRNIPSTVEEMGI